MLGVRDMLLTNRPLDRTLADAVAVVGTLDLVFGCARFFQILLERDTDFLSSCRKVGR